MRENSKFNLVLGELFNKYTLAADLKTISKELFLQKDKEYIIFNDNLSLPEMTQKLLDDIIYEKSQIIEKLNNIFLVKSKYNNLFCKEILDSNLFSSIISSNYDYIFEDYFSDYLKKITPFSADSRDLEKVKFYKIYGDLKNPDKFILSTQDIKRLKILEIYKDFWKNIRDDLAKRPTILYAINLNDTVYIDLLSFMLSDTKRNKKIYLIKDKDDMKYLNSERIKNFIDKYSINIIDAGELGLIEVIEKNFSIKKGGDAPQQGYA